VIPEQALLALPEALTGSKYPEQTYEGGIVGIFNLALLQTLNGRNVPDPMSCIQCERPFRGRQPWPAPQGGRPRYLRGDIFLDTRAIRNASKGLAAYGWRFENWIEAKFFRGASPNKQQNTSSLLADLLRIIALVPDPIKESETQSPSGRYLLHVYEGLDPGVHLALKKQIGGGTEPRCWLAPLVNSGMRCCDSFRLSDYETVGILGEINAALGDLELSFTATTTVVTPTHDLGTLHRQYTCILSRIDSFRVKRNGTAVELASDRTFTATPNTAAVTEHIREHVGRLISTRPAEEVEPTPDEFESEDEEVEAEQVEKPEDMNLSET
jgi:hypothetical protein